MNKVAYYKEEIMKMAEDKKSNSSKIVGGTAGLIGGAVVTAAPTIKDINDKHYKWNRGKDIKANRKLGVDMLETYPGQLRDWYREALKNKDYANKKYLSRSLKALAKNKSRITTVGAGLLGAGAGHFFDRKE